MARARSVSGVGDPGTKAFTLVPVVFEGDAYSAVYPGGTDFTQTPHGHILSNLPAPPATHLGFYQVVAQIGEGGMG